MNQRTGILVDTCALIATVNPDARAHETVKDYIKGAVAENIELYLSSLTIAEFCARQSFETIDTTTFTIFPFDTPESILSGQYDAVLKRETGDDRVAMKIDIMLLAHAEKLGAVGVLTLDEKSLVKYCKRLAEHGKTEVRPILGSEPFDPTKLHPKN